MAKLCVRGVLPLLLVLCAPCAWAQSADAPEFKMPCREVLKLGLNEFTNVYAEKTGDSSTYGMKAAFAYYVDCRRPANDALARKLTLARRKQAETVRDELSKIGNAAWDLAYLSAGGGTMYGLLSVSAYAAREDFMMQLISALGDDRKQAAARRRANASMAKAGRTLAHWAHMPKLEAYGDESLAEKRKQYRDDVKEMQAAVARLQTLIGVLPDTAAELAAKRVAEELDAEVGE
ncbi:MAG TPA: hypothetical protein VGC91_05440 [Pyrinomonadaceae bacterium]